MKDILSQWVAFHIFVLHRSSLERHWKHVIYVLIGGFNPSGRRKSVRLCYVEGLYKCDVYIYIYIYVYIMHVLDISMYVFIMDIYIYIYIIYMCIICVHVCMI